MPAKLYWARDQKKPVSLLTGEPTQPPLHTIALADYYNRLVDLIYRSSHDHAAIVTSRDIQSMLECSFNWVPENISKTEMFFGESECVGLLNFYPGRWVYTCPENPPHIIYIFEESDWEHSCEIHVVGLEFLQYARKPK